MCKRRSKNRPITLGSIAVSAGADFAQTHNCPLTPATLGGGSSCTIDVTFSPANAGSSVGEITITTEPARNPRQNAPGRNGHVGTG
jgi:hypothetical protein